jgi:hypothetical protein
VFTIFIRERTVKALLNEENVEIFCTFTTLSLRFPASEEEEEEEEEEKVVATHRATSVAALFRVGVLLVRPLSSPPRREVAPLADVCTRRIKREPSVAGVLLLVVASLQGEEAEEVSVLA